MDVQIANMMKEFGALRSKARQITAEHEELRCRVEELLDEQQRLIEENKRLRASVRQSSTNES